MKAIIAVGIGVDLERCNYRDGKIEEKVEEQILMVGGMRQGEKMQALINLERQIHLK